MKRTCYHTETQVRESGLLTAARFAEIQQAIDARTSPVFTKDGKEINNTMVVDLGDEGLRMYPNIDSDHMRELARRDAMAAVLTDSELDLIKKHCLAARSAKKDAEAFEKAVKVTEWDGGVWVDDTYYHTLSDALDYLEDEAEWPEYLWTASPQVVIGEFNAWDLCESFVCDRGWEDMDQTDLHGLKELQKALDQFTAANAGVVAYHPDTSTAVLLAGHKAARDERNKEDED